MKAYKESQGLGFLDLKRERQMLDDLSRSNRGPLSEQGLRELLQAILDLSKREVTSGESA